MRILFCYSKDHFNPSLSPDQQPNWGTSTNTLIREFLEALGKIGDVTYSDGLDFQEHAGESYDLFIGIERNFHKILTICNINISILIAVNMHPKARNNILNDFANKQLNDMAAIAHGDLVDVESIWEAIDKADYIFCFGNNTTYNSYLKYGVSRKKIKTFNYRLLDEPNAPSRPQKTKRFLYSASSLGLRKGFDIVASLCDSMKGKEFHIDIIGRPTSDYYTNKLDGLAKRHPGKVTVHKFIPVRTKKYQRLHQTNDFLIFPSLEEGQAGTVVEAMHYGLIPLITPETGTDFAPLGFLESSLDSSHNKEIMSKALSLTSQEIAALKTKTQAFYKELHYNLTEKLEEAVRNCLAGNLYPKVSLILPIYNKEPTIIELVTLLDAAAREYKNVEVHIIFDGCSDNSEVIVKAFYRDRKDYPVKFYTTPNIFETKTNNLGLLNSSGKYAVIIQDDNYLYDKYFLFEAVQFLDKNPTAAILGGLSGVNFYPLGTKNLSGPGQISISSSEVYWRQDERTNPDLKNQIFEVDACMRGPLILRKSFLDDHGFLDEIYAPLYQDDMDICFRARKYGYRVYCMMMDVDNKSLTMANYKSGKAQYFAEIMKRNAHTFYERWTPSVHKDYSSMRRIPIIKPSENGDQLKTRRKIK